jgi:hypothetical protein
MAQKTVGGMQLMGARKRQGIIITIDTMTKSAILYGGTVLTLDGDPGDLQKPMS